MWVLRESHLDADRDANKAARFGDNSVVTDYRKDGMESFNLSSWDGGGSLQIEKTKEKKIGSTKRKNPESRAKKKNKKERRNRAKKRKKINKKNKRGRN